MQMTLMFRAALLALMVPGAAWAQSPLPGPSEEARLYEGAKREGTVVWYGGAPLEPMQAMARDFEAKYPGVKVQITRIVGVAQYQRYLQETQAGQNIADVLHIGDQPSMADLIEQGYIVDWKVPTWDRLPPAAKLKTFAYTPYINDGAIGYNPSKVTAEEVAIIGRDWEGILDPRFKGRIATTDQRAGGHIAALEMFLDPKYKDRFGEAYLRKLAAQQLIIYGDVQIPTDRVIAGEQDLAIWPSEGVMYGKWQQGAPIRWVHPKPAIAYGNTWFGIAKSGPHPNAARLFMNWMMSDDGARTVETKYGAAPILMGVPDERPVIKEPWYQPITDHYETDWDRWNRDSDKDFAIWISLLKASRASGK